MFEDLIAEYNDQKTIFATLLKTRILPSLKDTTIPLDDRWRLYEQVYTELSTDSYGDGFIETLNSNFTLCDDFCMDRNETRSFVEIAEEVLINEELCPQVPDENLVAWKEEVLQSGYGAFTYDW